MLISIRLLKFLHLELSVALLTFYCLVNLEFWKKEMRRNIISVLISISDIDSTGIKLLFFSYKIEYNIRKKEKLLQITLKVFVVQLNCQLLI